MSYCIIHDLDHGCEYTTPRTNPLLTPKVRAAVKQVFDTQGITGPYPIVDALLNAIWEAAKDDRTL